LKSTYHGTTSLFLRLSFTIATFFCTTSLFAQTSTFTSFDAPGAGTGIDQGTFPVAINSEGVIAGYYFDNSQVSHGFLRRPNGVFIEFTPSKMSQVFIYGINNSGQVLGNGTLTISPFSRVGFIRELDGAYTIISIAGSSDFGVTAINNRGEATGYYLGADTRVHSFVRLPKGKIVVFDDPNATKAKGNGTLAWVINDNGEVGGYYNYNNITDINRAFVRSRVGNFSNFDAVSRRTAVIQPMAINLSGEVAGYYGNNDFDTHGFLRDASGKVTDFDVPDSSFTIPAGINNADVIVGYWGVQKQALQKSFVRSAAGHISTFAAPDPNYTTIAVSINAHGTITGSWMDLNFVSHGFFVEPAGSR
jgi:hypothetical protein